MLLHESRSLRNKVQLKFSFIYPCGLQISVVVSIAAAHYTMCNETKLTMFIMEKQSSQWKCAVSLSNLWVMKTFLRIPTDCFSR